MHVLGRIIATVWSAAALAAAAQVGYQWNEITPPGGHVASVGTHPLDGRIIAYGAFAVESKAFQVMYSTDHGGTWNPPAIPPPNYAGSMFVHIGLPGVVYLESMGSFSHPGPASPGVFPSDGRNGELYRSDDFGRTWTLARLIPFGEGLRPFASDPLDAHGAFGLARRETPCGFVPGCRFAGDLGVSQTHDDGASWSAPLAPSFFPGIVGFVSGPTPADPMRLFLRTPDGRVMETRDRGASWSAFAASLQRPLDAVVPDPMRANVLFGHLQYIDNSDASRALNQNVTLRSEDAGATWREVFRSSTVAGPVIVDPLHSRTLWFAWPEYVNGSGFLLYRSDDAGNSWQTIPYPDSDFAVWVSFNPQGLFPSSSEPGIVYVINSGRLYRGVPSRVPDPVVVEYQYEGDRYWATSLDGEAVSQDYRQQPGDVKRTGMRWGAWRADDAPAGALGSCRFWPKPQTGLRTRVLVLQGFECDILKRDAGWILEGENEFYAVAPTGNACPGNLIAVHRLHNLKPDLNHRWAADGAVVAEMKARGWFDEGVRFCARPLGSNE